MCVPCPCHPGEGVGGGRIPRRGPTGGRTYLTNRVPLQRAGLPDVVAGLVCYLAREAASYSAGADIVVDSGESPGRPSGSFVVES
ncbi:SDR family oxidoreductase [Pseudarthrobacter sp. B4EP4b]|uniref:SDR family oxidoreductase n=1 Tax=Pseudarthrobacter sp. B4EP4b TaxID=2590664 RepID=UPI001153531A